MRPSNKFQKLANGTKTYFAINRWDRRCFKMTDKPQELLNQVDITIWNGFPGNTKIDATVFVYKVWWQDNL